MKYSDEISIGEYVRTPKQGIWIISHINKPFEDDDENKVCLCQNSKVAFVSINTIKQFKHSKNIIDLIQKDDYVNGHLVIHKYTDTYYGQVILIEKALAEAEEKFLKNKDIKSVITAEQIKQIEFRIKE